jgi:hypothetical protein
MNILNYMKEFSYYFDDKFFMLSKSISDNLTDINDIKNVIDNSIIDTNFVTDLNNKLLEEIIKCYKIYYDEDDNDLENKLLNIPWIGDSSLNILLKNLNYSLRNDIKDCLVSNYIILTGIISSLEKATNKKDVYNIKRKVEVYSIHYYDMKDIIKKLDLLGGDIDSKLVESISSLLKKSIYYILYDIFITSIKTSIKSRYTRLCNTEGARAYYEGLLRKTKNRNEVFGYKWELSVLHYKFFYDVCDINASCNVGYGVGIYPKNKMPIYPAHPNCACNLSIVYRKDIGNKVHNRFNKDAVKKFINTNSISNVITSYENPIIR